MSEDRIIRGVVFDMDGLMIDSESIYWAVGRELARSYGKEISDAALGRMMGRKPLESMVAFVAELGLDVDPVALLTRREAEVDARFRKGVDPMPGLRTTLTAFKQAGLRLAIGTSARRSVVDILLPPLDVLSYFEVVQTSDDITNGKPDPEIYLKAISRLGLQPVECAVLEDSSNGSLAGYRAGAYSVAVPSIHTRSQDFSFAHYVAKTLSDAARHLLALAKR